MTTLETLLLDATAGDPIRGAQWSRKTLRKLAKALGRKKFKLSHETVRRLLKRLKYTQRANRKRLSRRQDVARDQQMQYLARQRHLFLKAGRPVISTDGKKKEKVGLFKNPGRTWRKEAVPVLSTDFPSDAKGKAIP